MTRNNEEKEIVEDLRRCAYCGTELRSSADKESGICEECWETR